jgi:hypothetical protein
MLKRTPHPSPLSAKEQIAAERKRNLDVLLLTGHGKSSWCEAAAAAKSAKLLGIVRSEAALVAKEHAHVGNPFAKALCRAKVDRIHGFAMGQPSYNSLIGPAATVARNLQHNYLDRLGGEQSRNSDFPLLKVELAFKNVIAQELKENSGFRYKEDWRWKVFPVSGAV